NVGRTQVEAFAGRVDANGVEIFPAEDFHARNDSVAGGEGFLHQRGRIDAEIEAIRFDGGAQLVRRAEAFDSRTAPADVGLQHNGIADGSGRGERLGRVMDDAGFGVRKAELFQVGELLRFGNFVREAAVAVDDTHTFGLQVRQVIERVEDSVGQAAL